MWPIRIDMNPDECRGMLRHLELEAYSTVMSTFRAQGMLNDKKKRLLDELRSVFHIPPDRHKAEARRVANDEKLCTIAEVTIGPNTSKEWWLEGKRAFPLLPRAIPYTAVTPVADAAAEAAGAENATLLHPQETQTNRIGVDGVNEKPIVQSDPLKNQKPLLIVDRKFLKRPAPPPSPTPSTSSMSGEKLQKKQPQLYHHLQKSVANQMNIKEIYHTQSKTNSRHRKQPPSAKKTNPKGRPPLHPKIPKKQLLLQQKQQLLEQQQQHMQMQQQFQDYHTSPNASASGSIYNNYKSNNNFKSTPPYGGVHQMHSYASPIPFGENENGGRVVYEMDDFENKAGPSHRSAQMPSSKKHVAYNSQLKSLEQPIPQPMQLLLAAVNIRDEFSGDDADKAPPTVQVINEFESLPFQQQTAPESCTIPVNLISKSGSVHIASGSKPYKMVVTGDPPKKDKPDSSASPGEMKFVESNILQKTLTAGKQSKNSSSKVSHMMDTAPTSTNPPSVFTSFDSQQQLTIMSPPRNNDSKIVYAASNKLLSPQSKLGGGVMTTKSNTVNASKVKMIQSSSGSGKIILNPQQPTGGVAATTTVSGSNKFPTAVATKISGIAQIKGLQTNIGSGGKYVQILPAPPKSKAPKNVVVVQKAAATAVTPTVNNAAVKEATSASGPSTYGQLKSNIIVEEINQQSTINVPFTNDHTGNNIVVLNYVQPEQDIVSSTSNLITGDSMDIEMGEETVATTTTTSDSSLMLPSDASSMSAIIEDAPIVFDDTPPTIQLPPPQPPPKPLMQSTPKQTAPPTIVRSLSAPVVPFNAKKVISIKNLQLQPLTQAQMDNIDLSSVRARQVGATKVVQHKNFVNYLKSGPPKAMPVPVVKAIAPKNLKPKQVLTVAKKLSTPLAIKIAKPTVTPMRKVLVPATKKLDSKDEAVDNAINAKSMTHRPATEDLKLYKQLMKSPEIPVRSTTDWESELDYANNVTSKPVVVVEKERLCEDKPNSRANVKVEKNELIEGPDMLYRLECNYANLNGEPLSTAPSSTNNCTTNNNSSLAKLLSEPQKTFAEKTTKILTTAPRPTTTATRKIVTAVKTHQPLASYQQEKPTAASAEPFTEYTSTQLEHILAGDESPPETGAITPTASPVKNNGQTQYLEIDELADHVTPAGLVTTTGRTGSLGGGATYQEIIVGPNDKAYQTVTDGGGECVEEVTSEAIACYDTDDENQMVMESFVFENFEESVIDES